MTDQQTTVAVFPNHDAAEKAVKSLIEAGFEMKNLSLVGHVVVLGYLAAVVASGIENAVVVGGLGALGAALYSLGVPKDSVLSYESDLKADGFLVMARGTEAEVERAKSLLAAHNPARSETHPAHAEPMRARA